MLVESGITLVKLWLDVSKSEQKARLKERRTDPVKKLKTGPMDVEAQKRFDDYTEARNEMLMRTHTPSAPWTIVRSDHKKRARLEVMRHLLNAIGCPGISRKVKDPDPDALFQFEAAAIEDGRLAR
jgi:polyphosphate kinase 2 (PPK2 family)